jgi:hypothetical protein
MWWSFRRCVARSTTLDTSAVLRQLGMQGGRDLSRFADGATIPTVQIADLSSTFTTERVEPRAMSGAIITASNFNAWAGVAISSLGPGGIVIEDLRLESLTLGGGGPPFPGFPTGSFVPWMWLPRGSGNRFASGLAMPVPTLQTNVQLGGPLAQSRVNTGEVFNALSLGAFLPPTYQLQPGARWYLPAGEDLAFHHNSSSDGAGADPIASVALSWREVLGTGGA